MMIYESPQKRNTWENHHHHIFVSIYYSSSVRAHTCFHQNDQIFQVKNKNKKTVFSLYTKDEEKEE